MADIPIKKMKLEARSEWRGDENSVLGEVRRAFSWRAERTIYDGRMTVAHHPLCGRSQFLVDWYDQSVELNLLNAFQVRNKLPAAHNSQKERRRRKMQ